MRTITVFNSVSMDGYFADKNSDMSWAHNQEQDDEFTAFVAGNAKGGGALLFGRKTFEMMASFWPTSAAKEAMPEIAEGMNRMKKYVVSRSLNEVTWENSELIKGDLISEIKKLKKQNGPDIAILGSGNLVAQLAEANLVDEYSVVVLPLILGSGRSQFDGLKSRRDLKLVECRSFKNGNVFLRYRPTQAQEGLH
ncbi:dihydrofolate reductase family protein [Bdellovibrio bacteriovorus]|uniref:Putative secreted protein n=1 Tax=Bdellovibrio bacteriovorus str. Tiberius TaxID=1069642 RepID=K7YTU7_BDEBC|nr:dihydrofolate reductase family protein [Bdellovibrio bacteriovorus]AFY00025.1 putative secreted protein [Bdellovibrio bacteriovorus str. Tiberius]